MLIYCLFLLVACCNLKAANGFKTTEVGKVKQQAAAKITNTDGDRADNIVAGKTCLCKIGSVVLPCNCRDWCMLSGDDCVAGGGDCKFEAEKQSGFCHCKDSSLKFDQSYYTCKATCDYACENSADCFEDRGVKRCQCKTGTSGPKCSDINFCLTYAEPCAAAGGECKFDLKIENGFCDCRSAGFQFDTTDKSCKDCTCGPHSTCSFQNGNKTCMCDSGYAELDGNCEVCNCGPDAMECNFNSGEKKCSCAFGYYIKHGSCTAIPPPKVEVLTLETTSISLRFTAPTDDFTNLIIHAVYRVVDSTSDSTKVYTGNYTVDIEFKLNPSFAYEFRFKMLSDLGNGFFTQWKQYGTKRDSHVPASPIIIEPKNGTVVTAGNLPVIWQPPKNNDYFIESYRVVLKKLSYQDSWVDVKEEHVKHMEFKTDYTEYFNVTIPDMVCSVSVEAVNGAGSSAKVERIFQVEKSGDGGNNSNVMTRTPMPFAVILAALLCVWHFSIDLSLQ